MAKMLLERLEQCTQISVYIWARLCEGPSVTESLVPTHYGQPSPTLNPCLVKDSHGKGVSLCRLSRFPLVNLAFFPWNQKFIQVGRTLRRSLV